MKCFNCQEKGHLAVNCPNNALFCSERRVDYQGNSAVRAVCTQGLQGSGKVDGIPVKSVVLDTGCSRTLVRSDLVSQDNLLEGEVVAICCAHGDTVLYPLAKVHLEISDHNIDVEAAVSDSLPMPVLLGTDVPQVQDLIGQVLCREHQPERIEDVVVVTTRAQYSKQIQHDARLHQADKLSGAIPMALDTGAPKDLNVENSDTTEVQELPTTNLTASSNSKLQGVWLSELDESIFEYSTVHPKLTRKQKCDNC